MSRPIPAQRIHQLVDTATRMFIRRGYRLTQMADVAEELSVGKGTLYGYVESKEALFDAALRYADGLMALPTPRDLPLLTPAPGSTVAYVKQRLAAEAQEMVLSRVVAAEALTTSPKQELEAVLFDLYQRIARNRLALKLVDRCAADYPNLGRIWFGEGRWAQHELLVKLIELRVRQGHYRPIASPAIVARTVLESITFWAMHRHFDPSPQPVSDEEAKMAVVDLVANGLFAVSAR